MSDHDLIYDDVNYALRTRRQPATAEELVLWILSTLGHCYLGQSVTAVLDIFVRYGTVAKHGSFYSIAKHPTSGGRFCRQSLSLHSPARRALYPWS